MYKVDFPPFRIPKESTVKPDFIQFELLRANPATTDGRSLQTLVKDLTPTDFEEQGLDPTIPEDYADTTKGIERLMSIESAARSDVPVGAYLLSQRDGPIGTAVFAREQDESVLSQTKRSAALARLHIKTRDSGIRFFTGWTRAENSDLAPAIFRAALSVAHDAQLKQVKIIKVLTPPGGKISVIEHDIDPTDPSFGFSEGNVGTAVIGGRAYKGFIFTRDI